MKKSNLVFNVLHSSNVEKNTMNTTASASKYEKYSIAYNYDSFNELSNAVIDPLTPELYNLNNKALFKDSFFSKDFKTKNKGNSNLKLSSNGDAGRENENSENSYLDYISPYLEKDELGGSSSVSYIPVKTFSNTTLNQIINQVDKNNIINNNNLKMSYLTNTSYPTNSSNTTNDTNDVSCFNNKNSQTQLPQSSNLYDPSNNIKSFTSIDTLSTKHTKQDKNTFLEEFYQNSNPDFDFEDWNSFSAAYNNSKIHDNKSPDLLGNKRDPRVDIFHKNEINNMPISNDNGVFNIKKINDYNNSINNTPYTCFNQNKSNFINYNINDGESLVSNLNVIYDQYSYSTSKPYNKSILDTLNNNDNDIYHLNYSNPNNILDLNEDNNKPSSNTPNDKTKNSKGKKNKRSNKLNASKKNSNQITNITNINNNTSITNITNIDNNNNNNTSTHSIVDFNPKMHCKFITKLVELLDSTDISDIISWNCDGTIIEIKNQSRFIEEVLPKHFKHNNYSNFTRQFNLYNFKKVKKYPYPNIIAYYNINFIKGRYELLSNIKRQDNNHPSSNKNKINHDTNNNENFSLGTSHKFINKNDKVSTESNNSNLSNNSNNYNQAFVNAEANCNDAGSSKENNEPKKTQTEEKNDNNTTNTASANNVNSTSNNSANNTTNNETTNKDNCNETNKTPTFIKSTGSLPNISTNTSPKNSTYNEINECCQKTIESVNSKIEFLSSKMLLLEEQVKSISQFNDALIERNTSLFDDLKSKDYYIKLLESLLLFNKETSNAPVKSITNNKADINSLIGGTKNDVNQKDKYLINSILNNKALLDEIVQGFEKSSNNINNNTNNKTTNNNNMNYYSNKQIYDNSNSNTNNNLKNTCTKEKEANTNNNNIKSNKNLKNELPKYPVFPIQSNNNIHNEMMNTNTNKDIENMNSMNSINNMNNMSSPSSELSHFNNIFSVNNHFDSGFNKQESFKNLFSFSNNKDAKKDGNDNTEFSNFQDEYFK